MRYCTQVRTVFSRSLCVLFLLLCMQNAIAIEASEIRFEVPAKIDQGTCIPLLIRSTMRIDYPSASLKDSSGRRLARCHGITLPAETYAYLVLLPVPTDAQDGIATIHITGVLDGRPFAQISKISIMNFNFINETIALNSSNTAIKTDTSDRKIDQINLLGDILNTSRPDAYTFLGPWALPVKATRRTSFFGDQRIFKYSNGYTSKSVHWGIDFGIPTGTPVYAAGDGIVVMASDRITTGLTVVIEHLSGVYSLYYHLDSIAASEGEELRTGTLIGKSGSTGLSTGPHLHWEFRVAGVAISPDWFVDKTFF